MELNQLTAHELIDLIKDKKTSPKEIYASVHKQIQKSEKSVKSEKTGKSGVHEIFHTSYLRIWHKTSACLPDDQELNGRFNFPNPR